MTQLEKATDLHGWAAVRPPSASALRVSAAKAFLRRTADHCGLQLQFPDGSLSGPPLGPALRIRDYGALAARLARAGEIGFGEAYMAGDWDSPDLVGLFEAVVGRIWTVVPRPFRSLRRLTQMANPYGQENDLDGSRRNIAHHYDLSNELFALFLDETMTYSSALFESPSDSLAAAQRRKIDGLLDAVGIDERSRLLEIGTGWGELATRAALRGAHVTTLTLSEEQAALARRRVTATGLEGRVDVRVQDYREVAGSFDAIVSVEMIEAVGPASWPTYFKVNRPAPRRRRASGTTNHPHGPPPHARRLPLVDVDPQIRVPRRGHAPSETAIEENLARHTSLRVIRRRRFGPSYARTLQEWRHRFAERSGEVDALGFDWVFQRMWHYYLAQSEAAFRAGYLDVAQLVLSPLLGSDPRRQPWPGT